MAVSTKAKSATPKSTGAKALIEAALDAKDSAELAEQNLQAVSNQAKAAIDAAKAALDSCKADLAAAEKALHDELAANGPRLYIDDGVDPPAYSIFAAADPDTYTQTPIEIAA